MIEDGKGLLQKKGDAIAVSQEADEAEDIHPDREGDRIKREDRLREEGKGKDPPPDKVTKEGMVMDEIDGQIRGIEKREDGPAFHPKVFEGVEQSERQDDLKWVVATQNGIEADEALPVREEIDGEGHDIGDDANGQANEEIDLELRGVFP